MPAQTDGQKASLPTSPLVSAPIVPASQSVSGLSPGTRGDFGGLKPRIYRHPDWNFWVCQNELCIGVSSAGPIAAWHEFAKSYGSAAWLKYLFGV